MALSTIVLVNQISNLSDARYCAGMGVEMLGFSVEENSPAFVAPEAFKEISGWVAGVQLVGEMEDLPVEEIQPLLEKYPLHMLQLNKVYLIEELELMPLPVILKVLIDKDTDEQNLLQFLELYEPHVEYFLIDSTELDSIDSATHGLLRNISDKFSVLVGFGLTKENTKEALEKIHPAGIALKGGQEIRPGFKDFDELEEIFEQLED
ncbi:hypothetical protein GU926_02315 [Nibribacter ruber]|uniref:N-(5'-phosphoribosyl)anthranilate isomerase n=1 Tax=Nibribacter ruber TaxID=2698458 RepID=A0A6P1NR73_9BACT|nr:hypothetical protein [Nibribacter ruber]QHL86336.1 hypothetical protein GU926_02315 [Nibribacter ruber]